MSGRRVVGCRVGDELAPLRRESDRLRGEAVAGLRGHCEAPEQGTRTLRRWLGLSCCSMLSGLSPSLEELNCALMFLRGGARLECSKITAFSGLRILLSRIQAVFARTELADHEHPRPAAKTTLSCHSFVEASARAVSLPPTRGYHFPVARIPSRRSAMNCSSSLSRWRSA